MSTEYEMILARLKELTSLIQGLAISPWFSYAEAANYARCSVRKIEQLVGDGKLPCHRLDPSLAKSTRLVHLKHLITFLLTGKNGKTQRLSTAERALVEDLL